MPVRFAAILCGIVLFSPFSRAADEKVEEVRTPPPSDTFLVLPIRVHILTSRELPEIDCQLEVADIARIYAKANRIWHHAGIHLGVESIVYEPAVKQNRFKLARDLDGRANLGMYRMLFPDSSRTFVGVHAYYLHRFPVNGVWLGGDEVLVQATARLREVEGGIDEPVPRVTAHELGHVLGLAHRQDRINLLASGTTGTSLNTREVETARAAAVRKYQAKGLEELRGAASEAEKRGDSARAARLRAWLGQIASANGASTSRAAGD